MSHTWHSVNESWYDLSVDQLIHSLLNFIFIVATIIDAPFSPPLLWYIYTMEFSADKNKVKIQI